MVISVFFRVRRQNENINAIATQNGKWSHFIWTRGNLQVTGRALLPCPSLSLLYLQYRSHLQCVQRTVHCTHRIHRTPQTVHLTPRIAHRTPHNHHANPPTPDTSTLNALLLLVPQLTDSPPSLSTRFGQHERASIDSFLTYKHCRVVAIFVGGSGYARQR